MESMESLGFDVKDIKQLGESITNGQYIYEISGRKKQGFDFKL